MRNCPFCKAEIDPDAKFCVYCMRSLVEKEKVACAPKKNVSRWLWIICLGLAIIVIALLAFLPPNKQASPSYMAENQSTDHSSSPENDNALSENSSSDPPQDSQSDFSESTDSDDESDTPSGPDTENTTPSGPNVTPTTPSGPNTEPTTPSGPNTESTTPSGPNTEIIDPPATEQVKYSYRLVASGEEYNAGYVNGGNDIIITGVISPSSSGEYYIPDYIDGKRVLVIASNAFTGSGAKKVVVPSTVKTIWDHAFAGCPLTDVYFCGNAIYATGRAFAGITGSLTIHCSATCSDRNFRYYKNTAPNYGAVFAEWNG